MRVLRRASILLLAFSFSGSLTSCASKGANMTPQVSQMKAITELATMEVFYHNVAKFNKKDASGFLLWKKDSHFWVEFSSTVKLGIDPSKLVIKIEEDTVTVHMPDAEVFDAEVEQDTLNKESFIVAKNSAQPTAEDETSALNAAEDSMKSAALQDKALMASAKQRAKALLEEYISNISQVVEKDYSIEWVDIIENEPATTAPDKTTTTEDSSTTSKDD